MIEPNDLLDLAEELIERDPRRPRQVSLRRAVSCAYYALFHTLTTGAAKISSPDPSLQRLIARASQHVEMKECCLKVSTQPSPNQEPNQLRRFVDPTPEVEFIASTFVSLQGKRHEADYDHSVTFSRSDTQTQVALARRACEEWEIVRGSDSAKRLAVLVLHGKRVANRL